MTPILASLTIIALLNLTDLAGSTWALRRGYMQEANPVARWLWNRYGVWGFVGLKLVGVESYVACVHAGYLHDVSWIWWAVGIGMVISAVPVVLLVWLWSLVRKFK